MKTKMTSMTWSLVLLLGLSLFSCKGKENELPDLLLGQSVVTMKVGDSFTVPVKTGSGEYEVSSSNSGIVSVRLTEKTLTLQALTEGNAFVTVKDKRSKQSAVVTVNVLKKEGGVVTKKEGMVFTLSATRDVELHVEADAADQADCWIDLNNNETRESGEELNCKTYYYTTYSCSATTVTLHGKITSLSLSASFTSLDVSGNEWINRIRIYSTFTPASRAAFFNSLPDRTGKTQGTINIPNSTETENATATAKNWKITEKR